MPIRRIPLVTLELYHLLNRGIAKVPIFTDKPCYERFLRTIDYYRFVNIPIKLSHFLVLSQEEQEKLIRQLNQQENKLVELVCYCAMPNHFHIVAKQLVDYGISTYMRKLSDSYTRYFNIKNERIGPLLQGRFKAVLVETEDQLYHLSRYVHINPFVGHVVNRENLKTYPYSSLLEYFCNKSRKIVNKELILSHFGSVDDYVKFIDDEVDYKAKGEEIAHLTLE